MLSGKVRASYIAKLSWKTDSSNIYHLRVYWILIFFLFSSQRFNDIHVPVRLECVKFASHCLMNHPDLAKDLTGVFRINAWCLLIFSILSIAWLVNILCNCLSVTSDFLKVRSHDPEEAIRHDVIVTIINAGKKDLNLVNDQLLGFVRERMLDKRVRKMRRLP